MKKRYNLNLDEAPTERFKKHLAQTGMTFSGFVNALIGEMDQEIQGQPSPLDKMPSEMTVEEFVRLMGYWYSRANEKLCKKDRD